MKKCIFAFVVFLLISISLSFVIFPIAASTKIQDSYKFVEGETYAFRDAFELAKQGDLVAKQIFDLAAKELAQIILAIYHQGCFSQPLKISYSGGIFNTLEIFEETFNQQFDGIEYVLLKPELSPLSGGIVLAMQMDNVEISTEIRTNLQKY